MYRDVFVLADVEQLPNSEIADLLGLSVRRFARLFEEVAHRPFPVAGDPGSVEWWRRREAGEEPADGDEGVGVARDPDLVDDAVEGESGDVADHRVDGGGDGR